MMRSLFTHALWLVLCLAGTATAIELQQPFERVKQGSATLVTIEEAFSGGQFNEQKLQGWLQQSGDIEALANACVAEREKALEGIDATLESLSGLEEPGSAADGELLQQKEALEEQRETVSNELAGCRLIGLNAENLGERVGSELQRMLAARLMARGEPLEELLRTHWQQVPLWLGGMWSFMFEQSGLEQLSGGQLLTLLLVLGGAIAIGVVARRRLSLHLHAVAADSGVAASLVCGLKSVSTHYLPWLLPSVLMALGVWSWTRELPQPPFITLLALGMPIYFAVLMVLRLFLSPCRPANIFVPLEPELASSLARRLKVLASMLLIAYLLFGTLLGPSLPQPAYDLARAVLIVPLVLNVIWVLWLFSRIDRDSLLRWLRVLLALALVGALLAELLAYRNLSLYILQAVLGSLFAWGFFGLLDRLFSEFFDGLEEAPHNWQRSLRRLLGVKPQEHFPGLTLLRISATITIWGLFALTLVWLWEVSGTGLEQLRRMVREGFEVGALHVVPSRILLAVLVLVVLFAVSRWFKRRLEQRWLLKTRMSRSSREAAVTFSGYLGVGLAVLLAMVAAGADFTSLALIAGALSVGIGFGLQNIVNNFVSGVILLIERPIKTGDWIVVGNTEGYVSRISIRSTVIQTFDRADVIVPNSELVSAQVTNWMLRDNRGRVHVPVGVAYGSDVEKVRRILLDVAYHHSEVIGDDSKLAPRVLFFGFGESSLDFELRCFIEDVDNRLSVVSDLNFAIDRAFREEGIEIPFPQRDVHIKSLPPGEPAGPRRGRWRGERDGH